MSEKLQELYPCWIWIGISHCMDEPIELLVSCFYDCWVSMTSCCYTKACCKIDVAVTIDIFNDGSLHSDASFRLDTSDYSDRSFA